ncbi:MAG: Vitamin B12 dependent methionine synthase activation subunit [Lachnospiraceae bacterium]
MDGRTLEAVRYLGYGSHAIDDRTLDLILSSFEELEQAAGRRIVYRIFDVSFEEADCMKIGTMNIVSQKLGVNLKGCERALLLGATLGSGVDRLLRRYSLTDMARVVVLQACAAALLEEYLDDRQEEFRKVQREAGYYLRPRFSPGYGDFPVRHQEEILRMLDAPKTIGLSVTDGDMLTPSKSVTAVIGLSRSSGSCHQKGCGECEKADCAYRRSAPLCREKF